ncbi:MAG: PQQ-binding-like beta-propeller repeat protein [Verrucomicrobiota bacterium]
MKPFLLSPALFFLFLSLGAPPPALGSWPEFRGPSQDGYALPESQPPLRWSETENVRWKTPIHGKGWSTAVILEGKAWLTTATEDGTRQSVLCLDTESGEILLDRLLFENETPRPLGNTRNTYASPSPVAELGRVYLHFGSYGTACLNTETLETIWTTTDYPCHHWRGPASSPILFEDLLILTFDGADYQYTVALDKESGEEVWKRDRSTDFQDLDVDGNPKRDGDFRKAFNTPILLPMADQTLLISPGAKAAWAYDPANGEEIWSVPWNEHSSASRTVFSAELGLAFFNTGYGKSQLWAVRLDPEASGDLSQSHVAWKATKRMPNRCSPILHDGLLYLLTDQGVLTCLNAEDGEEVWSERISEMPFSSSLLLAGGHLYLFDEGGKAIVLRPGRTYDQVAVNQLDDGFFASPSVSGNALFLRTTTHLYRIEQN